MHDVFILGANDPEMEAIVENLRAANRIFWFAAVDGQRCHPGNAYMANSLVSADTTQVRGLGHGYGDFTFVECRPIGVSLEQKHERLNVIDHHEEGDPGYDLGAAHFWEASSLGQVVQLLRAQGHTIVVTQEMRVVAAMDHCRQAAIRGECPGVTAEEVIGRRIKSIVARHQVAFGAVENTIADFAVILLARKTTIFGSGEVIDFTDRHLGIGYSLDWLCAQTALDMRGLTALLRNNESEDERDEKIMLSGHATPEMVRFFTEIYAPRKRLWRVFAVPKRGYAGGYLRP